MTVPASPHIPAAADTDESARRAATAPLMLQTLQWLPAAGPSAQLMILLHGWGGRADDMAPLAQRLRQAFPQAALLAPEGFEAADNGGGGRQWFGVAGADGPPTEANRPARVAAALPLLADWVRAAQAATGVGEAATALVGFSQGAIVALELVQRHDGIAGRVLAFAGRYASLPEQAPRLSTLHFFHGATDTVIPAAQARLAIERLALLRGDATIDIANDVGHALPMALADRAIERLRSHIPQRTWAAALGAVTALAPRAPGAGEDD
jgi:phospholipase/carboxylesterase